MWKGMCVALMLAASLAGCKTLPEASAKLSANMTQKCPEKLAEIEGVLGKDLMKNIKQNAKTYHECKDMHNSLVDALKDK